MGHSRCQPNWVISFRVQGEVSGSSTFGIGNVSPPPITPLVRFLHFTPQCGTRVDEHPCRHKEGTSDEETEVRQMIRYRRPSLISVTSEDENPDRKIFRGMDQDEPSSRYQRYNALASQAKMPQGKLALLHDTSSFKRPEAHPQPLEQILLSTPSRQHVFARG